MDEIFAFIEREEGNLSLDLIEDRGLHVWQMEVDGYWFEGRTVKECVGRAVDQFRRMAAGEVIERPTETLTLSPMPDDWSN